MSDSINDNLAQDLLKERRSDRLWRNIRGFLWMFIFVLYAVLFFGTGPSHKHISKPYAAVVRLTGTIMPGQSFSAKEALPLIQDAFEDQDARGVILLINSPGGSAAQASIIHDRLLQLKNKYHKKLIVVGEDALASGGYLVATAADKIYVNQDTLTGSIGVVLSGFGFVDAMNKLGITRRVFTAGDNKDRLDPFENLTPEDVTKAKNLLAIVHNDFIKAVEEGRGNRLKGNKQELFSGDFWTGQTAVELGLVDGVGDLWSVMQKEFNVDHGRLFEPKLSILNAIFGGVGEALHVGLIAHDTPLREQAY